MVKKLLALVFVLSTTAQAQDFSKFKELYMPNEAGGYIVLTLEPCKFSEAVKQGFENRAYATESDSEKPATHEGCWDSPSTAEAPGVKGVTIIPLVNLWFDGDTVTFPQSMFTPEKKRWDVITPTIEVKPNV